jgi:hypothetical protein
MEGDAMKTRYTFAATCGLALLIAGPAACVTRTSIAHAERVQRPVRLPLYFTPNPAAPGSFAVHGAGASAVFEAGAVRFDLAAGRGDATRSASVALDFIGASTRTAPAGSGRTEAIVNYFTGSPGQWRINLPTYEDINYSNLWPGIDLAVNGSEGRLKYAFTLAPGTDVSTVRMAYNGATGRLTDDGSVVLETAAGTLTDPPPVAFQERDGRVVPVDARFVVLASSADRLTVGFRVGAYDRSLPLVIDPALPVFAGFMGGAGDDRAFGVAVDSSGAAYVTGQSPTPYTQSPDAFVAKVAPDGRRLVYVSFIGGKEVDAGFDIVVDAVGQAYVTGGTTSDETTFPVAAGPDLTFNGRIDAFVVKLGASGATVLQSGYLGGALNDFAEGIALGPGGEIFVTGVTQSTERTFPVKIGPDLTANGHYDAFVAALKPIFDPFALTVQDNLVYAGYIGGRDDDIGVIGHPRKQATLTSGHIAVGSDGAAYISGITASDQRSFPDGDGFGMVAGFDRTFNGVRDAFVVKVRPGGEALDYATYLGGAGDDLGFGMAVDASGAAYLTGNTSSDERTFPVRVGPDLTFNGDYDAFVAKLSPSGLDLEYAGYLGGAGFDQGLGVALGPAGSLVVVGHTHSSEATFPVVGGPDSTFNGEGENGDAFVASVKPVPSSATVIENLDFCGYIGGDGEDGAFWAAVDAAGDVYVVGETASGPFTFPDGDGIFGLPSFGSDHGGSVDGFLVKLVISP